MISFNPDFAQWTLNQLPVGMIADYEAAYNQMKRYCKPLKPITKEEISQFERSLNLKAGKPWQE